jgi:predicted NBD/HSP70 family sugar kinase
MLPSFETIKPRIVPPLDESFQPAALVNRAFRQEVEKIGIPLILGLERNDGQISRFETSVFPAGHPKSSSNLAYVERLIKFLLWQRGGYKLYVGGPKSIGENLQKIYSAAGRQSFDYHFMGEQVYEKALTIVVCDTSQVPQARETGQRLGRHLEGSRIGFDLGASDRKVSAVVDGKMIYSEEVVWEPRKHSDPDYHYTEIVKAIQTAAGKMPRVDAIGGSSAGIYIDNRPMVASLFRAIPAERYGEIRNLFLRIRDEMHVPLEVINDGDVTALAGSMSIEDNGVLGIALGSSEAVGYVDMNGQIMGWLNELAFAPVDYNPHSAIEEWSGDIGCGASYFSQQCVFRLAPAAGIQIPQDITDADKLKFVQEKLEASHEGALRIWESMGIYLGYALAHYADFYDMKHVLILGRCTSGRGGEILLDNAQTVLKAEFPDLAHQFKIHLPDEKIRRIGQSVAAASLPIIETKNRGG